MQAFLISKIPQETISILDRGRLVKQNLEAKQILNTLTGKSEGWKSHPAVLAYKGYEKFLAKYGLAVNSECLSRGYAGNNAEFFNEVLASSLYSDAEPAWLSNEAIFASHRGRLKCKGEIDALCASIKKALKIKSINKWLKAKYGREKNQLKFKDIAILESFMAQNGIQRTFPNYYEQFRWTESPALEYVWPSYE